MSFSSIQPSKLSNFHSSSKREVNKKHVDQHNELQRMERLLSTKQSSLESLLISNNNVRIRCKRLDKKLLEFQKSNQNHFRRVESLKEELVQLKKQNADVIHSKKIMQTMIENQRSQLKYARSVSQRKQTEIEYREKLNLEFLDENMSLQKSLGRVQEELTTVKEKWQRLHHQTKRKQRMLGEYRSLIRFARLISWRLKKCKSVVCRLLKKIEHEHKKFLDHKRQVVGQVLTVKNKVLQIKAKNERDKKHARRQKMWQKAML